jgi:hypothetical protein
LGFSIADAQYLGNIEFYHLPVIVESKQYSILAQSIMGKFTGVLYDTQAGSLIFSISGSTDSIDTASITMNKQAFSELLSTDYAKNPDSMLVLINGVEQPYKTVEDDEIISWRFHMPSDSSEIEIIHSTPMFSTGTYSLEDIPFGAPRIYAPLKQNHVGIAAENIRCKENLVLIQKNDGSPACVRKETISKLIERGWAQNIPQENISRMMERGNTAMGFNQTRIMHHFMATSTGGEIMIVAINENDTKTINEIRDHVKDIQYEFSQGNFTKPFFIHDQVVPGTQAMAENKDKIHYSTMQIDRGSVLILATNDTELLGSIQQFMDFQSSQHLGH